MGCVFDWNVGKSESRVPCSTKVPQDIMDWVRDSDRLFAACALVDFAIASGNLPDDAKITVQDQMIRPVPKRDDVHHHVVIWDHPSQEGWSRIGFLSTEQYEAFVQGRARLAFDAEQRND